MRNLYIILFVISFTSCGANNKEITTDGEPCGYNDSITETDMIEINHRMDSTLYQCTMIMRIASRPKYRFIKRK